MIIEDESQHSAGLNAITTNIDPLGMQLTHGQPYNDKKPFIQYGYCNLRGHIKENCYKLVGYPYDFKPKKTSKPDYGGSKSPVGYGGQFEYGKQPLNAIKMCLKMLTCHHHIRCLLGT